MKHSCWDCRQWGLASRPEDVKPFRREGAKPTRRRGRLARGQRGALAGGRCDALATRPEDVKPFRREGTERSWCVDLWPSRPLAAQAGTRNGPTAFNAEARRAIGAGRS